LAYHSKNPRFETLSATDQAAGTISNPPSGAYRIINRGGAWYTQNSSGTETAISQANIKANVRASEGAGTTTLTNSDSREQYWTLTAGRNVNLPTTGVLAGDVWTMVNPLGFVLTIRSSGANNIVKSWGSRVRLMALIDTPTTAGNWAVIEHTPLLGRTWTSFSPGITNLGTPSGETFYWMRTGINSMAIRGRFISGTPGVGAEAYIVLPSSLSLDTTGLTDLESSFGLWHQKSNGATVNIFNTNYSGAMIYIASTGATKLVFAANTNSNTYKQDSPTTIIGGAWRIDMNLFNIPISEWSES
jgi:hypothetical protein